MRANWGLGLKIMTGIFIPDPSPDDIDAMARFQRESASAAVGSRLLEVYYETDIRELLPAIRARTAILHREGDQATGFKLGQEVTSLVPGGAVRAAGFQPSLLSRGLGWGAGHHAGLPR
jgi:rRNA pseudouridine-1189 N-methylase Emg1 (Nep1/Mra1 family)